MICPFEKEKMKECNIRCKYYHTCTRSEYRKKGERNDILRESEKR